MHDNIFVYLMVWGLFNKHFMGSYFTSSYLVTLPANYSKKALDNSPAIN